MPTANKPSSPVPFDFAADVFGFGLGLVLAWRLGWRTGDLIWNLWLSSLVIGYATIVLGIFRARAGISVGEASASIGMPRGAAGIGARLFLLVFFTFHFGLFHFVHSVFVNVFFPVGQVEPQGPFGHGFGSGGFLPDYAAVVAKGWPWLFAAAIAERRALWPSAQQAATFAPMAPYANVVRMHLLIFFFVGAFLIGLDGMPVYAVVYAVYFWPWRGRGGLRSVFARGAA